MSDDRGERVGVERVVVASVLVAAVSTPLAMSCVAIAVPSRRGAPLVLAVAGVVLLWVCLAGWRAVRGRGTGPLTRLAGRLPVTLDGSLTRRRQRAALWAVATLLAFCQIIRFSAFMADPRLTLGSAFPPMVEAVRHMCLGTYVHAADLSRRDDPNVYAADHYPVFRPTGSFGHRGGVSSTVANLANHVEDAYEYPPPFLLLPRLGLALSNDFLTLRTAWFALQATGFTVFAATLAAAVGGQRGISAGLLLPLLWTGVPLLINFQFGQFHLACVALAMGAALAFQRERHGLGGALLGAAIVSKLFPGLLLVVLVVGRRWRALLWTVGFCLGYAALGVAVLGWAPYQAFFGYQLPRILSGEAFSFFLRSDVTLTSNWGIYGIPFRLARLGVPDMGAELARQLSSVFTVVLLVVAGLAGRRTRPKDQELLVWLGLLVLGSLRSPLAPFAYAVVPALWLMTLLAAEFRGPKGVAAFVGLWLVLGNLPWPQDAKAAILVSMLGQAAMLALGFWVVLRRAPFVGGSARAISA